MISALATVEGLLLPRMLSLEQSNPALGKQQRQLLRSSLSQFQLGTLALHATWMASHPITKTEWVLALGETHHQQFRTQAIGQRNRQGVVPVSYGLLANHDAHPAPWYWDVVRLLTSIQLCLPKRLSKTTIGQAVLSDYIRVMRALANDDDQVERIDYLSLPEELKKQIDVDAQAKKQRTWETRLVRGKRLRLGKNVVSDKGNKTALTALFCDLLPKNMLLLDVAFCPQTDDVTTLGQRRWWIVCHEINTVNPLNHNRVRIGQIVERRSSRLAHALPFHPLSDVIKASAFISHFGHDPIQNSFAAASGLLMSHSVCHARQAVDLTLLDDGDAIRLGRLWGQLIAMHHAQGLRTLGCDLPQIADRLANQAKVHGHLVINLANEQSRWYDQAYRLYLTKS